MKPLHVYEWLDLPAKDESEKLAKEWLEAFVKQPTEKDHAWLDSKILTCLYDGKRWRCVGASTMGDVWLTSKIKKPNGYERRVKVEDCSEWERADRVENPYRIPPIYDLLLKATKDSREFVPADRYYIDPVRAAAAVDAARAKRERKALRAKK